MKWLVVFLFPFSLAAQKRPCPCSFQSILSGGVAIGQNTSKPLLQWSGGLNYQRYFAGLGAGIDFYRFQTIPVYADGRISFGRMKTGFLYAQAGYNFSFGTADDKGSWIHPFRTTNESRGGFYMDAGLGYRAKLGGSHHLLFSAGFSHKRVSFTKGYTYPCLVEPCPEDIYTTRYDLGRILAKVSWEWNTIKKRNH